MLRRYHLILLAFLFAGTARGQDSSQLKDEVVLFAAASTSDVLDELLDGFHRQHPHSVVRTSYAGTSTLARQISAGAGAHILLSASRHWAEFLAREQLVERQKNLLGNRLVIIVPRDAKNRIAEPKDLLKGEFLHVAMADPQAVPAGVYARQALKRLDLWESLETRIASTADVRQTLKFVETGAAEAGIVYSTDAAASKAVRISYEFEPPVAGPIEYPLLLTKEGAKNRTARALYDYLSSPDAAAVYRRHGFTVIEPSAVDRSE